MRRKKRKIIYVLVLLFYVTPINLLADEISFRCKVINEYELSDDGQLVVPEKYIYRNTTFAVDRSTGKIIGFAFNNKGDYQVKVIDKGSFKVFSFSEWRGVAETLVIKTWRDGEIKSFVGIDYLQTVVTGTCD